MPPSDVAVVRSIHVSTKNLSGHDLPYRNSVKQGDFAGRLRRICLHRKKINISTVLAGQRVGIKEVDDGIWIVSFMQYDLGYIDLEQKTLQPLDNPFGARLLPMS